MPADGLSQLAAESTAASAAGTRRPPSRPTRTITPPTRTLPAVERADQAPATPAAVKAPSERPGPATPSQPDPSYDRSHTTQLNLRVDSGLAWRLGIAVDALSAAGLRKPTQYEVVEALLAGLPTEDGPALHALVDQVVELRTARIRIKDLE